MAYKRTLNKFIRLAEKAEAHNAKIRQINQNIKTVGEYNTYIQRIVSYHTKVISVWGWHQNLNTTNIDPPVNLHYREIQATKKLESYDPNWFIRLFRLQEFLKNRLRKAKEEAIQKDNIEYEKALAKYESATKQIEINKRFVDGIKELNPEIYQEIIEARNPFPSIGMSNGINLQLFDSYISADCKIVNHEIVIPKNTISQTQTGKLSIKDMAITKSHKLYQEYVCSCTLRVARELFGLIPVDVVYVNAIIDGHNPQNGRLEDQPILSLCITRQQHDSILFEKVNPVSCVEGLDYNMNFKRTEGLQMVERLTPIALC